MIALPAGTYLRPAAGRARSLCRHSGLASAGEYAAQRGELWVFAYRSLMWQIPAGAMVLRSVAATLRGYERSFCVFSRNYRGSSQSPGLVLGLQQSSRGSCVGVALHLGSAHCPNALRSLEVLDAQEMISAFNTIPVYVRQAVTLECGSAIPSIRALAYVANPAVGANALPQLPLSERAEIIARAHGGKGSNREYLEQTAARLAALKIRDGHVLELANRVAQLPSRRLE